MADPVVDVTGAPRTARVPPPDDGFAAGRSDGRSPTGEGHEREIAGGADGPPAPHGRADRHVPTGKMVWRRAFTGVAEEAPKARAFVRCLLAGTRWVDDAEFAVAELVSNSLLHSRSGAPGGAGLACGLAW